MFQKNLAVLEILTDLENYKGWFIFHFCPKTFGHFRKILILKRVECFGNFYVAWYFWSPYRGWKKIIFPLQFWALWKNPDSRKCWGVLKCWIQRLGDTKRGNFGSVPLTDTMLGPTRPCTTCVGWAWDHGFEICESTSYIITRVDATKFRSLLLIISTLVVGESWRLAPYQFGGKYSDDVWVESWEELWLTTDLDHCWAGIIDYTSPCWVSWRLYNRNSQKYEIPIL